MKCDNKVHIGNNDKVLLITSVAVCNSYGSITDHGISFHLFSNIKSIIMFNSDKFIKYHIM